MASVTSKAVLRLYKDLEKLHKSPLVGANAMPLDENLMKWYAIVVGSEGTPYAGVPIRFVLEFDHSYPDSAPKAFFETDVRYTGGASYMVDGRMAVCLSLFGNFGHVHTEWKSMEGEGWTPGYDVSAILVSMQGLMMSGMLSTAPADIAKTIATSKSFKCSVTGHDGSDPEKWFPRVMTTYEEVCAKMAELGISSAPKFDAMRDHYVCYVTHRSASDGALLGYGIDVKATGGGGGTISSTCEYLSREAYESGIRRSSTNKEFKYWIPVLITSAQWKDVHDLFFKCIFDVSKELGYDKKSKAEAVIKVCSSLMNTLVVEIMNNKGNLSANDKFINGYFSIYRLLIACAGEDASISDWANDQLKKFITNPASRVKAVTPNLGEVVVYPVVSKYKWEDISSPYLLENDARNFFWYAQGTPRQRGMYPELISPVAKDRVAKVFRATEVSRNIVSFQVKFSRVASSLTSEIMDSNFGLAPEDLRKELKDTYAKVTSFKSWNDYFEWLGLPPIPEPVREKQLVDALMLSGKCGYHK
jgi:ubiquitin-protein ligase